MNFVHLHCNRIFLLGVPYCNGSVYIWVAHAQCYRTLSLQSVFVMLAYSCSAAGNMYKRDKIVFN